MNFEYTPKMKEWIARVTAFMDTHIYPNVETFEKQHAAGDRWVTPQIVHDLKAIAKKEGLWNMFMPPHKEHDKGEWHGAGLTNLEYAPLAEIMGRVSFASEVFNCSAPDTGNMEVLPLLRHAEQKEKWLRRC
jgi:acyl-CoA dehydrogenase